MKTMIRSFASALVAVMTLGLVQTAQAEPCSIEQLVEPEGACTITQDKTQAEGGEEVKFTLSNIKEGYQVEDVKVFLYGEGGEIYPEYNYEEDYYSFNMPEENVYIYVRCVKPTTEYSITYNASPEAGGKVEGGPTSATAETVIGFTVAATNEAYAIDSVTAVWGSGTVDVKGGEGGYYWFDMPEGAVTVTATFVKAITGASISGCPESAVVGDSFQLAVNVEPSGEGVEPYTTTWSSSDSAVATIDDNGKVSVVGPGKVEFYAFVTGQRSGAELAAGVTCTAEAKKYSITIPKFENGVVTSNVASTNEGATVTLTVTPDKGYELDTIKVDGIDPEKGEGSTYTFTMPDHDVEVQATFKEATKYSITTVADPEGTCLFDVIPELLKAAEGEYVEFHLNPASGATIQSLTVYKTDDPDTTITYETYKKNGEEWHGFNMRGYDVTIKVKMESEAKYYSINIPEFKGGTVTSNVASTNEGATVTLTVTPDAGYELDNITVDGLEPTKGEGSTYTFEMPNHDVEVAATFKEATKYSITTVADPEGTCLFTVDPETLEAAEGEYVQFRLNPASGATIQSLTVYKTDDPDTTIQYDTHMWNGEEWHGFNMPDYDVTIKVTMESEAKYYSINIPEFKGGTVTSNVASTNEGATVTLTVTPDAGYELDSITVDGLEPTKGEGSTYTFEMPNHDVEVAATFKEATKYKIDTSVTPSEACEVHVQDSAQSGADVYFEVGNFAAGATLGSLTVWNMSVGGVSVEYQQSGKGYTFKMPDGDVLIQVVCSDPEPPKDPEILNVTAQQRYPWNGLVDIGYTVTGTVPDDYVLKVSAMDMKTYDTFDAKTITAEEFPLSEGSHTLKWDMNADGYTTTVSDSIFFMVSAESSAGASFGATSSTVKLDLRTGTTREIALGATETLTYSTDYEGGPTPPVQEGVQLWENGPYFAETNIGAKNPYDYGYYFWWGDTVGYYYSENEYGEGVWTAVDGSKTISFAENDKTASQTLGLTIDDLVSEKWIDETSHNLLPEHDAATAHLDKPWRMPTSAEMETLCSDVCDWKAVTDEDGNLIGYMVSGREAYAGNSIFLPAAGYGDGSGLYDSGSCGYYWSSTPDSGISGYAWHLRFISGFFGRDFSVRFCGFPVRPVRSATASAAANGASNEGETVTITVNGKTLKSGLIESGTIDWTPTEPGEYVLNHIVNSADGATEITNLVARYNVAGPTPTVEVMPLARSYTSEIGAYTNGVLLTATVESTYIVNSNATVDVVFEANTSMGRYFKVNGVYMSIVTNTITASTDPYVFRGPLPDTGKKVGTSAYAFVDGATCTIVGSGTADTRLSTVVSPGAITSVVIQPGITEVGARFFKDFKWLNAVTGGQDLATVGEKAFYKCFSLETIDLDCTAVPTGLDGAVVYQNALKPDGTIYQIPNIKVKNHVATLYGKENLDDDWECLGPAEGAIIYDQGIYRFFQTRLEKEEGNKE